MLSLPILDSQVKYDCTMFAVAAVTCKQTHWLFLLLQYKDRIDRDLIKPAVNFRETGSRSATMKAAVSS